MWGALAPSFLSEIQGTQQGGSGVHSNLAPGMDVTRVLCVFLPYHKWSWPTLSPRHLLSFSLHHPWSRSAGQAPGWSF